MTKEEYVWTLRTICVCKSIDASMNRKNISVILFMSEIDDINLKTLYDSYNSLSDDILPHFILSPLKKLAIENGNSTFKL